MNASLKSILLPTRFSLLSQRAAEHVSLLTSRFDSHIHIIHVMQPPLIVTDPAVTGAMAALPMPMPPSSELLAEANSKLRRFVEERFRGASSRIQTFCPIGTVIDEIVTHAQRHSIDMIVMGTHADGLLKRLVFGSVGRGVLESSPCPVLLVPVREARSIE
ncbi:MAG: universal stress protein [Phycisphaeraceae bacterium]|nr:universal stress protein [Phycisphaeraceae bacterium]